MRQCEILVNQKKAGILTETDENIYIFKYDSEYMHRPGADPVSATMPLREEPYVCDHLFPVFFNMLTEGANREVQSHLFGVDINDDFGIMLETCIYDVIGGISIIPIKK